MGRGRPRKNPNLDKGLANGSLSHSDFISRKKDISNEAHETLKLGKLVGAVTIGEEDEIIKDIAIIIEAREMGH
ncbi:hypothetical protein V6N13_121686 [Hibiscus sabdariffa]